MGYREIALKYYGGVDPIPAPILDIDALNYISGTTIPDASGFENNGVATNVTCSTSLYNFRNSTSDKIQIPSSSSLVISTGLTLEVLFRSANNGQSAGLISCVTYGYPIPFSLYTGQGIVNNKFTLHITQTTGGYWTLSPTDLTYSANEWVHLTATFDSATGLFKMYKNAIQSINTFTRINTIIQQNIPITIGTQRADNYDYNLNGDIMIARIYNVALTQDEITARFEAIRGRVGL
jgi:hypothetical protein